MLGRWIAKPVLSVAEGSTPRKDRKYFIKPRILCHNAHTFLKHRYEKNTFACSFSPQHIDINRL
jgi:hypothetical protein